MDILEINRLRVHTEVGCSPHELGKKREIIITIHVRISTKRAGETDRVEDTIDYRTITKDVLFHVENKRYNLIEAVAADVARICVVRHGVPSVKVTVEKPNAVTFSESSIVTIERRWEDFDWHEAHISIGTNIEPEKNLSMAMDLLKEHMEVLKVSKAFKTTPVGDKKQADFLNMAALVKTKLGPAGLKQVLSQVEHKLGRKRDPSNKTVPITIDLDISFWGNITCDYKINVGCATKTWALPDPDTLKYAHVIIPLADVTPEFIHPTVKKPLRLIAQEVSGLDDFRSFFPVTQTISANEVHSTEVNTSMVLPSVLKGNSDAVEKPFKNGIHLNGFHEPGSESPVALVTGAAKRLGACIAIRLHEKGYNMLVHYNTSTTESTDLVKKLNSIRLNSAQLIRGDLGHNPKQTADRIVDEALGAWGRLDLLVNNASQFHQTEVGEITEEEWNGFMAVNLSAPFFLSQAAFPSLKASGGSIVNILDIHAERPLTHHSVYCISKAGLLVCTMALAKEFAPFVRVNGVSPGAILWPEQAVNDDISTEGASLKAETLKKVPMNRGGEPSDVTQAVEYLACACSAGYVTGQVIRVDGGRILNQ